MDSAAKKVTKPAAADAKKAKKPKEPESLKKAKLTRDDVRARRAKALLTLKKKRKERSRVAFKHGEQYAREYRMAERKAIREKRLAKQNGNFYVDAEPKLAFVVRIRGINGLHPRPRKILQLLRLRQINNGVFIRLNKATLSMLRLVEPYVAWGYPNLKSIRELVYKRGYAKVRGQRIRIQSNETIANSLASKGMVCVEDVVHELYTVGKNFKDATSFLWPFKLSSPNGGFRDKGRHFVDGGDFGNRENRMNPLLRQMV